MPEMRPWTVSLEKMTQESTSEAKNERIIQMKYNGSEA